MVHAPRRPGRAARAAGAVAVVAGLGCGAAALVIGRAGDAPALDVTAATAPVAPSTVPPAPTTTSTTMAPPVTAPPDTATTLPLPLSPLHALIGEAGSAAPVAPMLDIAPVAISIDPIGVHDVPVRDVGLLPDGELEIPGADEVGWYRLGAAPGQPGTTVLAAHVSWNRQSGPFLRLGELAPGAQVVVGLADGTTRTYEVVTRAQHPKRALPPELWRTSGPETLVLITCGGAFDEQRRRYADNIVVTAVPVA